MSFNSFDTPSIAGRVLRRAAVGAVLLALASCAPQKDPPSTDIAVSCAADAPLPMVSLSKASDGIGIDPAGQITLVRLRGRSVTVDRYLPDGRRCSNGLADLEIALDLDVPDPDAIAIGPSGELIVVNDGGDAVFTLVRCLVDGTLDTSFGDNGFVVSWFDLPGLRLRSAPAAVVVDADGSILVAGTWGDPVGPRKGMVPVDPEGKVFAVVRHRADGTADPAFADGGYLTASVAPGQDAAFGMSVAGDGSIVLVGESGRLTPGSFDNDVAVLVLDAAGRPRGRFGNAGAMHAHVPGTLVNSGHAAALAPDGSVVVIPWVDDAPSATIGRFSPDGTLDASFGKEGFIDFPDLRSFVGMAVQVDGRMVVSTIDGRLVRINHDGTVDDSFGSAGITLAR
jgi:uncharacterized delta-60 repeat protein